MRITLIAKQGNDRHTWHMRLAELQKRKNFQLESRSEAVSEKRSRWPETVVWVLDQPEALEEVKKLKAGLGKKDHLLVIWPLRLESELTALEKTALAAALSEVCHEQLKESEYNEAQLTTRLLKPRTRSERLLGLLPGAGRRSAAGPRAKAKRLKLCVCGETALAYELAAVMAAGQREVLVMDLDRLSPSADVYTGVKPLLPETYEFFTKVSATGLNVLLDCGKKGPLLREAFSKCTQRVKGVAGLSVLTGVYRLSDYEYYRSEDLTQVIERAAAYYDVVVMKTNAFPYDGFTLTAMVQADCILTGLRPELAEVRAHRQLGLQLMEKQRIAMEKQLWVGFEAQKTDGLSRQFLEALTEAACLGYVGPLAERQACAKTGEPYLAKRRTELEGMYRDILNRLEERAWQIA